MNLNTALISLGWVFVGVYTYDDPSSALKVLHSWQCLKYELDSSEQSSDYDCKNNFLVDMELAPDGRTFVTIMRDNGVLANLATIGMPTKDGGGPLLRPYPDWSWNNASNCDNIIAVYRMSMDPCNRLWVLDSGIIGGEMVCSPKLLAFDLTTDELVQRVDIPQKLATNADGKGLLVNFIVNTVGIECAEINIYMADMLGNGLVVWNGNDMWRIESPYFESDPNATEFAVHGTDFNFTRGLFALSMTKDGITADRLLYFRPLSSYDMYHTPVADLHLQKDNQSFIEYFKEPTKLPSQSVAQTFSSKGILFFSGTTEMSIRCWNRHKPFIPENIVTVAQNDRTLQWVSAVKVYPGMPSETLWILSDRWQDFYTKKMNFKQTNFRILVGSVDDLVRGTNCE